MNKHHTESSANNRESGSSHLEEPDMQTQFMEAVTESSPRLFWEAALSLYGVGYLAGGRIEDLFLDVLEGRREGMVCPEAAAYAPLMVRVEKRLPPWLQISARQHFLEDAQELLSSLIPIVN